MEKAIQEKEFLSIIGQYKGIIFKVASFYADEDSLMDDLYQDIVLNLWKGYSAFRNESAISTWIYRVALNTCISYYRKKVKTPVRVELTADLKEYMEENENISQLYTLINHLGKMERALILLYLEDRPYKEIAEIVGITTTNVSTKINRIKEKLKTLSKQI